MTSDVMEGYLLSPQQLRLWRAQRGLEHELARHLARGAGLACALELDVHRAVLADADELGVAAVGDETRTQEIERAAHVLGLRGLRGVRVDLVRGVS